MSECPLTTERDWIDDNFGRVCPLDRTRFADCDGCSLPPLLKALPEASEEQIRIAEAVLAGEYIKAKNLCTDLTPTSPDDYDKPLPTFAEMRGILKEDKPCPTCGGRKKVVEMDSDFQRAIEPCPTCHGTGKA